jgi:hypothetical protein
METAGAAISGVKEVLVMKLSTENVVHRLEVTGDTHSGDLANGRVAA